MEFKIYNNMLERPFYVLAVSGCTLIENDDANNVAKLVANSNCFCFVCTYDSRKNRVWTCVEKGRMKHIIIELCALADECMAEMKKKLIN